MMKLKITLRAIVLALMLTTLMVGLARAQAVEPKAKLSEQVLIVGGVSNVFTAELYDPASGTFALTKGDVNFARLYATATRLKDGRVLVTGGYDQTTNSGIRSAELYDPST
jgi:hypothetical protein